MDQTKNIWPLFENRIISMGGIIYYQKYFLTYLKLQFENFIKTGVYYVEARGFLNWLEDENDEKIGWKREIETMLEAVKHAKTICPIFDYKLVV